MRSGSAAVSLPGVHFERRPVMHHTQESSHSQQHLR
jgi:hypothetical protein